jgi:tetratricopeptide (TPR) repeat protein
MARATDWYRREQWTSQDREEFFTRLRRSRASKAQYIRVQVATFLEAPNAERIKGALELAQIALRDYPEKTELALLHAMKGDCHVWLGEIDEAIASYRQSFQQQRIFPNVISNAHASFGQAVAENRRHNEYDEALKVLDEFGGTHLFPIQVFTDAAVRAMIYADRGDRVRAIEYARRAVATSEKRDSGLRYHKNLGLVGKKDAERLQRMREILASQLA